MTTFIAVCSGKGGVGKTTVALNLASALTAYGRDVIIVDGNLSTANVGLHLGSPFVSTTIHDVLRGKTPITDSVYLHPSGIKVVPGSITLDDCRGIDVARLPESVRGLSDVSELVIIDSSASLDEECIQVMKASDQVLVVTQPDLPSVTDALKTIRLAQRLGRRVMGVILNRVADAYVDMDRANVEAILEHPVIAVIPEDRNVKRSLRIKHPVVFSHPGTPASVEFRRVAAELIGERYEERVEREERSGMFAYMLRRLGLK
ncbi:cell division ATPase MinD [Candidatus Woesearchaeota archaeon]|nr:cell division ATPase MinD [Candidatus Woesearchaeota archaeon]